ncbi:hypothetical protein M501DRAFT_1018713 [Patellaria atrata CBS 101060]|uniref:Zn(2)-C6 fungal-type domain-containing protein n=1 Tax=Patellaria atrata CBS 101060 TaxID=1346257 RepID=A0A9P4S646_9PEZI|nr:hypothetical protein M501DRAFT_1018713 [Patellaria atrata CBS 101060]
MGSHENSHDVENSFAASQDLTREESVEPGTTSACQSLADLETLLRNYIENASNGLIPELVSCHLVLDDETILGPALVIQPANNANSTPDEESGSPEAPATVSQTLGYFEDSDQKLKVQRAASKAILGAISASDGFDYVARGSRMQKKNEGRRYRYICKSSVQNKGRPSIKSEKSKLKPDAIQAESMKATYECEGYINITFSDASMCIEVDYNHLPIHRDVASKEESEPEPVAEPIPAPLLDDASAVGMGVPETNGKVTGKGAKAKTTPRKRKRKSDTNDTNGNTMNGMTSNGHDLNTLVELLDADINGPHIQFNDVVSAGPVTKKKKTVQTVASPRTKAKVTSNTKATSPVNVKSKSQAKSPHKVESLPQARSKGKSKSTPQIKTTVQSKSSKSAHTPNSESIGNTRQKISCLSCRVRKNKCDESRPSCSACDKKEVACINPSTKPATPASKSKR